MAKILYCMDVETREQFWGLQVGDVVVNLEYGDELAEGEYVALKEANPPLWPDLSKAAGDGCRNYMTELPVGFHWKR